MQNLQKKTNDQNANEHRFPCAEGQKFPSPPTPARVCGTKLKKKKSFNVSACACVHI